MNGSYSRNKVVIVIVESRVCSDIMMNRSTQSFIVKFLPGNALQLLQGGWEHVTGYLIPLSLQSSCNELEMC